MGLQILERKNILWWEFVALFSKHLFCSGVLGTLELVCLIPLSDLVFFCCSYLLQTTIKIYTACLRQDIEYKTLGISYDATSKSVVQQVLRR